jgi:hypothetical protein
MMHAVRFVAAETMKMMIRLFFAPDVQFLFINLVLDLKKFLKMIGYAIIVTHSDSKED